MTRIDPEKAGKNALENFHQGFNCAQSLALAFQPYTELDRDMLLKLSSPFGGGMGRLREICGAFSGSLMILGLLLGYDTPETGEKKAELYSAVQAFAAWCQEKNGSIVCHELLGLQHGPQTPVPEKRTEEYYRKRPCGEIIGNTATLLAKYLNDMTDREAAEQEKTDTATDPAVKP